MNRQNPHSPSEPADAWSPCSPGTLGQIVQRQRTTRRRKTELRVGTPVLLIVFLSLSVWTAIRPAAPPDGEFGGLLCSQVQANMQQYAKGELAPAMQDAFTVHLAECPACSAKIKAMREQPIRDVGKEMLTKRGEGFSPHRNLLAALVD